MTPREAPIVFHCGGEPLLGIVHHGAAGARVGVLIVVGGPQYRVGSHRQFVLLARHFAAAGVPAMRFDYRGMGDSGGAYAGFESLDADIAAAIDAFRATCPRVEEIVLWGLCDAASAILFYAHRDPAVRGIVIVNPWVRTVAGGAKAYLKHYYGARILDGSFWRKVLAGEFDARKSLRALLRLIAQAGSRASEAGSAAERDARSPPDISLRSTLPERMAEGLRRYRGPVLLFISGKDLTAREFEDAVAASALWKRLLSDARVTRIELAEADHTFSRQDWRDLVGRETLRWIAGGVAADLSASQPSPARPVA